MGAFLAEIQLQRGQLKLAAGTIEQALAAGEDSLDLIALSADLQFELGNLPQALNLYTRVPLDRLKPVQLERLAAAYYNNQKLSESLIVFRRLLHSAGRPVAIAHNNVGVVLEAMDSLEAAEAEYRRAVELEPDYADAWFNLGNLAGKQKNPEQALEYYTRARSLEGSNIEVESALGSVLMQLERYDQAFEAFLNILAIDSTHIGALLGAADALWQSGKASRAVVYYRKLRALARKDIQLPEYVRRRTGATEP
jgi:tetratricopeptide (TPR) repeat protein